MTYTVTWYRLPNGKETDAMDSKYREFDSLEKAVDFAMRRSVVIRGIYWEGARVDNEKGNTVFEITYNYEEIWHTQDSDTKAEDAAASIEPVTEDESQAPIEEWTPIVITDKATGRKVHATIIDAELYKSGVWSFEDLWEMYKDDVTVQIMNGTYKTGETIEPRCPVVA